MNKEKKTAAVFGILFIVLIILLKTVDVASVGPEGTDVGLSSLNLALREVSTADGPWYKISSILGYLAILAGLIFPAAALVQAVRRKSVQKLDRELKAMILLDAALAFVYVLFEVVIVNYRPVIMEGEVHPEASFPSSHTMLACVILGSITMVLDKYIKNTGLRYFLKVICVLLAAVIVITRFLSGVHWFTDIIGALLISGCLLGLFADLIKEPGE